MESEYCDLLDAVLSDNALDDYISTCTCSKTLNTLIDVKYRRILKGKGEKILFSIDQIYTSETNESSNEVFEKALFIIKDPDVQLVRAVEYLINQLLGRESKDEALSRHLTLLNIIIEYCHKEKVRPDLLTDLHSEKVLESIVSIFNTSSKFLFYSLAFQLLPNYLLISSKEQKNNLLEKILQFVKKSNKLDILVILLDHFIDANLETDTVNLLKSADFWLFLNESVISTRESLKQVLYIFSKSIETCLKSTNPQILPTCIQFQNSHDEIGKIWKNYFIVLEVSTEKQLHLIEPSLNLLESLKPLHIMWRITIYRIFLNHTQGSIVYAVALHILRHEFDRNFSELCGLLLTGINRNEYSPESQEVFQQLGCCCKTLNNRQFEILLKESLNVSWTPVAMWSFCNCLFNIDSKIFRFSTELFESVINKLKLLPDKYIRSGCLFVVGNYFTKYFVFSDLKDFLKVSSIFSDIGEILFAKFILFHKECIMLRKDELINFSFSGDVNSQENKIRIKIYSVLCLDVLPMIKLCKNSTIHHREVDFFHLSFFEHFDFLYLEGYIENRLESIDNSEKSEHFILLNQKFREKFTSKRLHDKALEILTQTKDNKYNTVQQIVAFTIINNKNYQDDSFRIIKIWKDNFIHKLSKLDEQIAKLFMEYFFAQCSKPNSTSATIENFAEVLGMIFDLQGPAMSVILENIWALLKYSQIAPIMILIERCCNEFVKLPKTGDFQTTTEKFLEALFNAEILENQTLKCKVLNLSRDLLQISNNHNKLAYVLSLNIEKLSKSHCSAITDFVPLICDLILLGSTIHKTDRISYGVYQEIAGYAALEDVNPNFYNLATRISAIRSMINIIQHDEKTTDIFISSFIEKYLKNFDKRYFPDSQIHLEKLRIFQVLLMLNSHTNKANSDKIIQLITDSFLLESHQSSVKHLMQWLLICLLKNDGEAAIKFICGKLQGINNSRPSTVAGFIPVLYQVILHQQGETLWDQTVKVLLHFTMGAQFKLRTFSQVALMKLYREAENRKYQIFTNKYQFMYESIKMVIEANEISLAEMASIDRDFLEYFSIDNVDYSTVFYQIPKETGVVEIEWENLNLLQEFRNLPNSTHKAHSKLCPRPSVAEELNANIQKKITPWKDFLEQELCTRHTNNFILVTSLVEKPANLGGLSRTCEVFGIKQLVMKTSKIVTDKEFKSLSMSSENWLDISELKIQDLREFILSIKMKGYCVIGAEQTSESVKIYQFKFPTKTVLLLGNEKAGISPDLIPLLDYCIEIPQFGVVRSLNVHIAGAIVIWEYCKQHMIQQ